MSINKDRYSGDEDTNPQEQTGKEVKNEKEMSAQIIGCVPHFRHEENKWSVFYQQLTQFFIANDITDDTRKKAIFLTSMSEESYILLQNLMCPRRMDEASTTFKSCVEVMDQHFKPMSSAFAERYTFYNAKKTATESINDWAVRVRSLAVNCNFGTGLDDALRDRFIMGLEKGPARDKIFMETLACDFRKAVEIANTTEYIYTQHFGGAIKQEVPETFNYVHSKGKRVHKKQQEQRQRYEQHGQQKHVQYGQQRQEQQQRHEQHEQQRRNQTASTQSQQQQRRQCTVCGQSNHISRECKYKNFKCYNCQQRGHLKTMCTVKEAQLKFVENSEMNLFALQTANDGPIRFKVCVNKIPICMELDTGSEYSILSAASFTKFFSGSKLVATDVILKTYNGVTIYPIGSYDGLVELKGKSEVVKFLVVNNGGPPLLGRNFLRAFGLQIENLNFTQGNKSESLPKLFEKFPLLFDGNLGCFKKSQAKLQLIEKATPKFFKPRPVPLAIQEKVEKEINSLVHLKVLEPVEFSEWATPIVPILKKDGGVRICGDFKVSVNPNLVVEQYPLPRIEDLFAKLHGGEEFTKLDLSTAYQQVELEPESRKLTTIATTKGLFQYTRLVYGLASAPAIFQKIMEGLFMHVEGVVIFLDDILITAPNRKTHLKRLEEVLGILQNAGLKLAKSKCQFCCKRVEYLGHIIDKNGLHPNPAKTREIDSMPYPQSVKELQAFLGVVNFYRRFLPDVAKVCAPLYDLLKANKKFVWSKHCKDAVDKLKAALKQDTCLAHFDPKLKTKLTVDASPVGVGAVLSQLTTQGIERPIEFASRRLSETEQKYSQLDREAVAILFGVKKFHHYLYGRHFTLVTDNKPLHHIFDPKKGIPVMAANRLQRIALTLSGYTFDIVNIKSKTNIADYFSRNPSETKIEVESCPDGVFLNYVQQNSKVPLNIEKIKIETHKDKLLQKVYEFITSEWPSSCTDKELRPFFDRKLELSADAGCVFWGHRLIIPGSLKSEVTQYLHASHLGIAKTKAMARECCWWPTQSADIEQEIKSCDACLMSRPDPAKQTLKSWNWPEKPWTRVHIDFFGPFMNRWCLIVVDSYSKWVECIDMGKNTTSKATITVLKQIFARFGLPETLVSDNGTAFVSGEFKFFLERNSIKHVTSPVGHPASNGQAENYVKVIKTALKRGLYRTREEDFHDVLNRFLLDYRNALHSSTGASPAQLMFGRQLRTRLDILNPKREADLKSDTSVRQ